MANEPPPLDASLLQRFHPLSLVPEKQVDELLRQASLVELKRNQFLFKKAPPPDTCFFLLDGEVEVRESFNVRQRVVAGDELARTALEEHCRQGASVRAVGDARVLTLPRDAVDMLLASTDEDETYDVQLVVDSGADDEARFDDNYSEDWMVTILESPLVSCLSPADIQRCFMELERVNVEAGIDVVTAGTRGEHFYILMHGEAEVLTDPAGPFAGQRIDLVAGNYFGEEALIADTIRNATVRMNTAGMLGRLSRQQFDDIFRKSLVQRIDPDKAREFLDGAGIKYRILDVRFAAEFRHGHREGAENLPIVSLRKKLNGLDRNCSYLVTADGGRRSDLGVFLLRQAGITAYLLTD